MRILVIGAGAMGGLLAVRFAHVGADVTVLDVGEQVRAIEKNGIRLIWSDGRAFHEKVPAFTASDASGTYDVIILGVKAHVLEEVASRVASLAADDAIIVTLQNGIPWWYFERSNGPYIGHRLESLDPKGILQRYIDPRSIIGCVAYPAAGLIAPGIVQHIEGERFPVGELDGIETSRVTRLKDLFLEAGLKSRVLTDIRDEIWLKAWGSLSFNPISALCHATLFEICKFPDTRDLARTMMLEAQEIAGKLGVKFRHTIEERIAGSERVGFHKTSMLQDVEAGRTLEIEALVGSVLELGKLTQTPTPAIQSIYACTKLLNHMIAGGLAISSGERKPTKPLSDALS